MHRAMKFWVLSHGQVIPAVICDGQIDARLFIKLQPAGGVALHDFPFCAATVVVLRPVFHRTGVSWCARMGADLGGRFICDIQQTCTCQLGSPILHVEKGAPPACADRLVTAGVCGIGLIEEANAPTDPWSTGGGIGSVGASPRGQGHIMLLLI